MPESFDPLVFAFVLAGWLLSLSWHEFAHALVAYKGGDYTVREKGYLSFNPFAYTDPAMSILWPMLILAIGGIALPGGAVYIEYWRLRSRWWDSAVSLAGPAATGVLALAMTVPFHLGLAPDPSFEDPPRFWAAYAFLAHVQFMAFFLNLLPVPPLDGFGAYAPFLPPAVRAFAYRNATIFFLVLLVILWRVEAAGAFFWGFVDGAAAKAGVPLWLSSEGHRLFRPL